MLPLILSLFEWIVVEMLDGVVLSSLLSSGIMDRRTSFYLLRECDGRCGGPLFRDFPPISSTAAILSVFVVVVDLQFRFVMSLMCST